MKTPSQECNAVVRFYSSAPNREEIPDSVIAKRTGYDTKGKLFAQEKGARWGITKLAR